MAKKNGLGASLAIDDSGGTARTVSNDMVSISVSTPKAQQNITGLDKSAMERLQLVCDGKMNIAGIFSDTATTGSHVVLATIPSTSVVRTVTYTVQSKVLAMEMLFPDYPLARGADGAMTFSLAPELADGSTPTWA